MTVRQPAQSSDEFFYGPEGEGGRKRGMPSGDIKRPSRKRSWSKARKQEPEHVDVPALEVAETKVNRSAQAVERPVRTADPLPAAPKPKRVVPVVTAPPAASPPPVQPPPPPVSAPQAPARVEAQAPAPQPPPVSTPMPSFDVNASGSAPAAPGPAPTRWKSVGGMLVPDDGPDAPPPIPVAQQAPAAEATATQPLPFAIPTGVASHPDVADPNETLDANSSDSEPPTLRQDFKRRRRGRLLPALIAALLVSGAAGYFAYPKSSTDAELVSFRYAYEAGDKRIYDITMQMDMKPSGLPDSAPFQGTMNATMGLDVVSKAEDGSTIIEIEMSNISVQPNLGTGPGDIGKMRVSIAPDGRVTKVEGVGGPFGAAGIDVGSFLNIPGGGATDSASSQFLFPQFPNEGVRPGDSWTEETVLPLPFSVDPIKVTSVGTFEGYEQTTYGRAAQMHHVVTMPMNFSFTLAELFQSMAAITEGGAPPVPIEAQGARFVISGSMKMITDSLVLPGGGDITKMSGTTEMDLNMHIEGVPASALEGSPGEFSMAGTISMTILRTDGV